MRQALVLDSDPATVGRVDPSTSAAEAKRGVRGAVADGGPVDTLGVTWKATTNTQSVVRVLVEVNAAALGSTVWLDVRPNWRRQPTSGLGRSTSTTMTRPGLLSAQIRLRSRSPKPISTRRSGFASTRDRMLSTWTKITTPSGRRALQSQSLRSHPANPSTPSAWLIHHQPG